MDIFEELKQQQINRIGSKLCSPREKMEFKGKKKFFRAFFCGLLQQQLNFDEWQVNRFCCKSIWKMNPFVTSLKQSWTMRDRVGLPFTQKWCTECRIWLSFLIRGYVITKRFRSAVIGSLQVLEGKLSLFSVTLFISANGNQSEIFMICISDLYEIDQKVLAVSL